MVSEVGRVLTGRDNSCLNTVHRMSAVYKIIPPLSIYKKVKNCFHILD